jgi:hypothetical protein
MTPLPASMPQATKVFTGAAAEARTQQLGVRGGTASLLDSLRDGASAARATTADHPRSYRGLRMWAETVASLRTHLRPNWERESHWGVDLVIERRLGTIINVVAGDAAVGYPPPYRPEVRYERGDVSQAIVNGWFDTLFEPSDRPQKQVWLLLHCLSKDKLQAELSLPTAVRNDGHIDHWLERILLPDTPFGESQPRSREDESPPTIDVDVQRRAG